MCTWRYSNNRQFLLTADDINAHNINIITYTAVPQYESEYHNIDLLVICIRLLDIVRLILTLYGLVSIFKTIIDTIFI